MKCSMCGYDGEIQSWKHLEKRNIIICPKCKHEESLEIAKKNGDTHDNK